MPGLKGYRFSVVWLLAVAAAAGCSARVPAPATTRAVPVAVPQKAPCPPVVLLTAFEPFAGLETNTSWEVAKRLAGERVAGHEIVVVGLPVVWERARAKLGEAVKQHEPEAAISMGVGWSGYIEVERVARNARGPHKDNRGLLPPAREVEPGGPAEIETRLPTTQIVERLKELGLPVRPSDSAGKYLCNEAFYSVLRATGDGTPAGFIHLPRAGPDRARRPTRSEMEAGPVAVEGLARGIRAAIEDALGARQMSPQSSARQ